jgi:hypothetical protein
MAMMFSLISSMSAASLKRKLAFLLLLWPLYDHSFPFPLSSSVDLSSR